MTLNVNIELTSQKESETSPQEPTKEIQLASRYVRPVYHTKKYAIRTNKKIRNRKQRTRHENLCDLISLLEADDDSGCDDTYDIIQEKETPFKQVFTLNVNFERWTDFISQTGEKQERYIESLKVTAKDCQETNEIKRTPNSSFNNIDKNIKILLKREFSLGYVEKYEEDLIAKFSETTTKQLIDDVSSSFERMIVHGICQYHNLESRSVENSGKIAVAVENKSNDLKNVEFPLTLSDYLKRNVHNSVRSNRSG